VQVICEAKRLPPREHLTGRGVLREPTGQSRVQSGRLWPRAPKPPRRINVNPSRSEDSSKEFVCCDPGAWSGDPHRVPPRRDRGRLSGSGRASRGIGHAALQLGHASRSHSGAGGCGQRTWLVHCAGNATWTGGASARRKCARRSGLACGSARSDVDAGAGRSHRAAVPRGMPNTPIGKTARGMPLRSCSIQCRQRPRWPRVVGVRGAAATFSRGRLCSRNCASDSEVG